MVAGEGRAVVGRSASFAQRAGRAAATTVDVGLVAVARDVTAAGCLAFPLAHHTGAICVGATGRPRGARGARTAAVDANFLTVLRGVFAAGRLASASHAHPTRAVGAALAALGYAAGGALLATAVGVRLVAIGNLVLAARGRANRLGRTVATLAVASDQAGAAIAARATARSAAIHVAFVGIAGSVATSLSHAPPALADAAAAITVALASSSEHARSTGRASAVGGGFGAVGDSVVALGLGAEVVAPAHQADAILVDAAGRTARAASRAAHLSTVHSGLAAVLHPIHAGWRRAQLGTANTRRAVGRNDALLSDRAGCARAAAIHVALVEVDATVTAAGRHGLATTDFVLRKRAGTRQGKAAD